MKDAQHFFSVADQTQIAAAIKAVEAETVGEIAVMVVDESDSYPEGIVLGGIVIGALTALALADFFFRDSLWIFIPCAAISALVVGFLLKRLPMLHRLFIPLAQINHRVEARAAQAFYAKGLHRTRNASGVLFFLSLFERKAWVLADQGIYQMISQAELQTYAHQVVLGIKNGQQTEALCSAIARFGKVLALHFPARPDDTNELSNEVMVEAKGKS